MDTISNIFEALAYATIPILILIFLLAQVMRDLRDLGWMVKSRKRNSRNP